MKYIDNTDEEIKRYYKTKELRGWKRLVETMPTWQGTHVAEAFLVAHAIAMRERETNPRHVWDIEYLALTTPWEEWFWQAFNAGDNDAARVCLDHCGEDRPSHVRVAVGRLFG